MSQEEYYPLAIDPSKLAVNDTNCHLGRPLGNKITIKNGKLLKKKTNKYFKWVLKKNYNNIDNFIASLKKNISLPPNVIKYLNNKIDNEIEDNKYFITPYFAEECYQKEGLAFWVSYTPEESLTEEFYRFWKELVDDAERPFYFNMKTKDSVWKEDLDLDIKDRCFDYPEHLPFNVISFPSPFYMCKNEFYTEYALSLIFSDFYTSGKSIHFVPVKRDSFSTCLTFPLKKRKVRKEKEKEPKISINEFFSMDHVKGHPLYDAASTEPTKYSHLLSQVSTETAVEDTFGKDDNGYLNACLIQVLHSIAVYQNQSISHNDLHGGNIIMEQILYSTQWDNQELIDYDYFQYKIGNNNKSLYIPFVPFLPKIIDFGLSCKYGSPEVILNESIMTNKVGEPLGNPQSLIPPNWYFPAYDILIFLFTFCTFLFPQNLLGQRILWVALHFPDIPENEEWTFLEHIEKEDDPRQFYLKYNKKWVTCIRDVNPNLPQLSQVTLEINIIDRYEKLNSSSLLQKCMNNHSILKPYTDKPPNDQKCIILGTTEFRTQPTNYEWRHQKR